MRKYIVIRFNNVVDGVNFMLTYEYPCSFIVDPILNRIYDKNGNLIEEYQLFEPNISNYVEMLPVDIRNVITDPNLFIESEICYDGNNLFIDKNI